MAELTTGQALKQSARTAGLALGDRMKVAKTKTSGSSNKDIDIALVKATTARFHVVPKEKHVATLKMGATGGRVSASYIAAGLLKRLQGATDWLTALKTLICFHRLFRETDAAAFMEELLRVGESAARGRGGRVLGVENFLDTTNVEGRFDYSEWVRAYGKYLDEQLEVFSVVAWHVDLQAASGAESQLRSLPAKDLLHQLPPLQRLQRRLIDCVPRGQAARDDVSLLALSMVVRESFPLYKAISEGVINLADRFFQMDYLDAVKGLEVYREAISAGEALSRYYADLQQVDAVKRAMDLPQIVSPPADFVASMEAYLKDAPRPGGAEGEAPVARGTAPLRKGRLVQPLGHRTLTDSSETLAHRDPGMLLPAGALAAPPTSPHAAGGPVENAAVEREGAEAAAAGGEEEAPRDAAPAAPVADLLGFDDLSVGAGETAAGVAAEVSESAPEAAPTALDLLGQLDFGQLAAAPTGGGPGVLGQYHPVAPPAGIKNPFAAPEVPRHYAQPPPHLQQLTQQPFAAQQQQQQYAGPAYSHPAPCGSGPPYGQAPTWQQQQYQQQQHAVPYPQQQQPLPYTGPGQALPSPSSAPYVLHSGPGPQFGAPMAANFGVPSPQLAASALSPAGGASWAPTPSGPRDPSAFRNAGAHDPFAALLPPSQAAKKSPGK